MLTGVRLYVGIAALVASGVAGWVVQGWRMGKEAASLGGQVVSLTEENRILRRDLGTSTANEEQWRNAAMGCSDSTATLAAKAQELEQKMKAFQWELLVTRQAWQARENEMMQPLPADCDEAVREAVRRAKGGSHAP